MAQGYKVMIATRRLWVQSAFEGMNYYFLIFSFLPSGTNAKPGVDFRHSTLNASKNSAESGERSVLTQIPSAYPAACGMQREADLIIKYD